MIPAHNGSTITIIIVKLLTKTPYEFRMCPIDFGVECQGNNSLITENSLCSIIDFLLHSLS